MSLIYIGIGLLAVWFIVYVGLKIVKWFVHILLILAIIAIILWVVTGGQHVTYTIPFVNQTITT